MRSFSSSSGNKYHNYYLRKRRKWPHPIYKQRWHQKLTQQHAMQNLKHQLLLKPNSQINPLTILINSFNLFNSDPSPNAYHFLIKTLMMKNSHHHHIDTLLTHIELNENFETPESLFYDLIEFYGEKNEFQKAIDVFFKVEKFRCLPSVGLLNCLVSVLCKRKEGLVIVPQVLVKSRLMNIRIDESSFVVLIKGLCRFRKAKCAVGLLCHMFEYGIEIDRSCFSLVLSTLCRFRDNVECGEVMGLVEEMRKLGFCFDRMDYVNVIRFLVICGKGLDALELLSEMKRDGFMPDVVCYTVVLDGVISIGEYECAERLFDEMLLCGLVPDISTYNVYVNGLCKQKKFDNGIMMLSCMEEIGCKPNTVTYNTILSAIYESGEIGLANDFLAQVRRKGIMLNSRTYEIMICRMVDTDYISKALDLLEEMVDKRLLPQSATFDDILCKLCQKGLVSKALNLLTEMLGKNVIPGCRSWKALLVELQIKHDYKEIDFSDMEITST
ncbi:Pentatricopeptide repeat-containing protein [Artemisia annua]|uniref:Pentatricopeptide repeat-containing protein n=1 Tax=Artemisia annua TaxID=35608 RepID=A0A2U1K9Z3_ARTAN|nr:Pentatricopeptide repeat-containing protein [Artemisia annua]